MTRFYVLFNSISVISGRCLDDNERLWAIELVYGREHFASSGDRTRSARSAGQGFTHWATGAPLMHSRYLVWQHTFVSPSAFSRRAVVSYWRKYVHEVLVNRLGGLSLPRKSLVRLTYRPDMTLDVYRGRKTTIQQQQLLIEREREREAGRERFLVQWKVNRYNVLEVALLFSSNGSPLNKCRENM